MKLRLALIGGFIVLVGLIAWYQISSRVIAEKSSPSGGAFIIVREVQLHPASLGALLRSNEMLYRCEYYPHQGWPMLTAHGFVGESFLAKSVKIEWENSDVATVRINDAITFECAQGRWKQVGL
jgi:hypothetical protein